MINWPHNFTGLLFYAVVGTHQVRINNYQKYTLPLSQIYDLIKDTFWSDYDGMFEPSTCPTISHGF